MAPQMTGWHPPPAPIRRRTTSKFMTPLRLKNNGLRMTPQMRLRLRPQMNPYLTQPWPRNPEKGPSGLQLHPHLTDLPIGLNPAVDSSGNRASDVAKGFRRRVGSPQLSPLTMDPQGLFILDPQLASVSSRTIMTLLTQWRTLTGNSLAPQLTPLPVSPKYHRQPSMIENAHAHHAANSFPFAGPPPAGYAARSRLLDYSPPRPGAGAAHVPPLSLTDH